MVERNIATLCEIRQQMEASRRLQDRVADRVTRWSGSMAFAGLHAAWFAGWIVVNLGLTPLRPFDPFPFGLLTMIVSLEATFLSTFVVISQNRADERRQPARPDQTGASGRGGLWRCRPLLQPAAGTGTGQRHSGNSGELC